MTKHNFGKERKEEAVREWEERKNKAGAISNSSFSKGCVAARGEDGEGRLAKSVKNSSSKEVRLEKKPEGCCPLRSCFPPMQGHHLCR